MGTLQYGEPVILMETRKNRKFMVTLKPEGIFHTPWGAILHQEVAGKPAGSQVFSSAGHPFIALRPRVGDLMVKVKRQTQIVYPKDAGWLLLALDLSPGDRVVEMGTGSGAFTILLARFVGPEGRVYSFDRREDFLVNALENIDRAGLAHRVEASLLSAGEPFGVEGVDAVFLDLPEPWLAIPPAYQALAPGRPLALILPTAEQLKEAVGCLVKTGFTTPEVVELLERRILVRQQAGVRPEDRMVGFTGYLVTAQKRV